LYFALKPLIANGTLQPYWAALLASSLCRYCKRVRKRVRRRG
jgi:hypothetical protein